MRGKAAGGPAKDTMKIDIKDFGPIRRGRIEIAPMTVLTGSNNSGKSYAALLIRSMFGNIQGLESPFTFRRRMMRALYTHAVPEPIIGGSTSTQDDDAVSNATAEFFKSFQKEILRNMERTFSADLATLIRIGAKKCTIRIQTDRMKAEVNISKKPSCKASPSKTPNIVRNTDRSHRGPDYVIEGDSIINLPESDHRLFAFLIVRAVHDYFKSGEVFYLPAARSGILQGHKAISASIIRHAPYAALEEVEIPKLPGVVSDFIGDIIEMPDMRRRFYNVALDLEKDILRGQIKTEQRIRPTSDIKYIYKEHEIPLHLASSTVSEMAPLILYLKHMIYENTMLIIEEPEAHLDPHNQAILAKYLVRLVRLGLRIVLTTHSPFIVDRISNLIQAGSIVANRRTGAANPGNAGRTGGAGDGGSGSLLADLGLGPNDYLSVDEVAAYAFEPSKDGYDIRRQDVEDDGIPAEGFVNANDALYREYLTMQDHVNG